MNKIPAKNYIALAALLLVTVLITISFVITYKGRDNLTSNFYGYANKIKSSDFDEYMIENSDLIIYLSDKYDLTNESFENKLKDKLDELNLKDKLIYIDKEELTSDFLKNIHEKYKISVDIEKLPMIVIFVDRELLKTVYVDNNFNVENLIDYEVFE